MVGRGVVSGVHCCSSGENLKVQAWAGQVTQAGTNAWGFRLSRAFRRVTVCVCLAVLKIGFRADVDCFAFVCVCVCPAVDCWENMCSSIHAASRSRGGVRSTESLFGIKYLQLQRQCKEESFIKPNHLRSRV